MLREISANQLWAIEDPFSKAGLELSARMLIARRADALLWIHAPFAISDADESAIRALGEVRDIVVPNTFHYLEVGELARRFPDAQVWAPPQLAKKLRDVPHRELQELPAHWSDDFDAVRFDSRFFHEWAWCHRASRTLLLTDLLVNIPRARTPLGRVVARLADVARGPKPTRLERLLLLFANREELKTNWRKVSQWDFQTISMAHGDIIERDAKGVLRRAYRWL